MGVNYGLVASNPRLSQEEKLEASMNGSVRSLNGKLFYRKFIDLKGVKGIELIVELPDRKVRQQNYLKADNLYTLIAVYSKGSFLEKRCATLFTFFKFTP